MQLLQFAIKLQKFSWVNSILLSVKCKNVSQLKLDVTPEEF